MKKIEDRRKHINNQRQTIDKVERCIRSNKSLNDIFVAQQSTTTSDNEIKIFLKTANKFSKESLETKHFSHELDDSTKILNSSKKLKQTMFTTHQPALYKRESSFGSYCDLCLMRQHKNLIIDERKFTYMILSTNKPLFTSMKEVKIRNIGHDCNSLVSASEMQQIEVERIIEDITNAWSVKEYSCIIMETFMKTRKSTSKTLSGAGHFQVHCIPIKKKYSEKVRMCFKQALLSCGEEWSMNKKLICTDNFRQIQRYLPATLSYFFVCFDNLKNGFGHVIENEESFSQFFGFEVLASSMNKEINLRSLERQNQRELFEKARDFKLMYSNFKSK